MMPSFWIFVVKDHDSLKAHDIYTIRMKDKFWGIGEKTPNRKRLGMGDRVVFYQAGPEGGFFKGNCNLASSLYAPEAERRVELGHSEPALATIQGVDLTNVEVWDEPHILNTDLIRKLEFISNKERYGTHFQGGVIALSEDDFDTIVNPAKKAKDEDIENPAEFQLETFLHQFIVSNFESLNFGEKLEMFRDEDGRSGSEYATPVGYIDLLCREKTGGFVVIELKRGLASDKVIGQTLRYIGWVKENLAAGKDVRGMIIAKDIDQKLRYSLPRDPRITLKTYQVAFQLRDA